MYNNFLAYIQQLELIAFFSGYPLVYATIFFIADNRRFKNNFITHTVQLLPLAYALVGSLFLGFLLKKLYPDYSVENIKHAIQQPYLVVWGLLSILFWVPALSKKKIWSLLHGLVFFLVIVKDMFFQLTAQTDNDIVKNDMKVYLSSIILNLGALIITGLISFFYTRRKKLLMP